MHLGGNRGNNPLFKGAGDTVQVGSPALEMVCLLCCSCWALRFRELSGDVCLPSFQASIDSVLFSSSSSDCIGINTASDCQAPACSSRVLGVMRSFGHDHSWLIKSGACVLDSPICTWSSLYQEHWCRLPFRVQDLAFQILRSCLLSVVAIFCHMVCCCWG